MCNTKRAIEKLLNIVLLLLLSLLTTPDTFAGEADRNPKGKPASKADFVLTVKENLISLKAKDASLKKVLEEIGRRMSIEVLALLPEQEKVTTEFEQLPLEEAIERLTRNYPNLIVSHESDKRITKIIALQKSGDAMASKPATQGSEIKKEEIKKEEKSVELETKVRAEPNRKDSPPQKSFGFQFDPSQYGGKRR
jgi:type II secretory pathway component GspD/PulD (secretin)